MTSSFYHLSSLFSPSKHIDLLSADFAMHLLCFLTGLLAVDSILCLFFLYVMSTFYHFLCKLLTTHSNNQSRDGFHAKEPQGLTDWHATFSTAECRKQHVAVHPPCLASIRLFSPQNQKIWVSPRCSVSSTRGRPVRETANQSPPPKPWRPDNHRGNNWHKHAAAYQSWRNELLLFFY